MPLDPSTPSENLLFTTAIINTPEGQGTGFFFKLYQGQTPVLEIIVTNKHVIGESESATFRLHTVDPNDPTKLGSTSVDVEVSDLQNKFFDHPNSSIDLCAIRHTEISQRLRQIGHQQYWKPLSNRNMPSDTEICDLSAMEEIIMIGYPIGLSDVANNLPLLRRGITASHPSIDFNGQPEFAVDIACFPGSSGSPIAICNENFHTTKTALMPGSRLFFLGVLSSGAYQTTTGEVTVAPLPTSNGLLAKGKEMIHLGYAIKAKEVVTMAEAFLSHLASAPKR